jgi:hypothetical protein
MSRDDPSYDETWQAWRDSEPSVRYHRHVFSTVLDVVRCPQCKASQSVRKLLVRFNWDARAALDYLEELAPDALSQEKAELRGLLGKPGL